MLKKCLAAFAVLASVGVSTAHAAGEVVVYSARIEDLIKPIFDRYTAETGVKVSYVTDGAGPLLQRLKAEGARTRADMLITTDAGNLWFAAQEGVLAPLDSEVLKQNVPEHLRDPDNQWFGLSMRARPIMYSTERVDPQKLSTYEALGDSEWKGRLCLRTSKNVYTQSLVATMIARHGEEKTEQVVRGWIDNLATDVFTSDTRMIEALAAGQCDIALANTYYLGRLQRDKPDFPVAPFWPNQADTGVHVNVSGAGITKHAKNREEAVKLLEWLSQPEAQGLFAALNLEYPVNPEIDRDPVVAAWGEFEADDLNVAEAGRLQSRAVMLMDRAGYR
jgi:iron(III) transport system substrate-binding protein